MNSALASDQASTAGLRHLPLEPGIPFVTLMLSGVEIFFASFLPGMIDPGATRPDDT